jgi:hypothetical protein
VAQPLHPRFGATVTLGEVGSLAVSGASVLRATSTEPAFVPL